MPSHDDDAPLSAATDATVRLDDTSLALDPATFDLNDFIGGVRPTRRAVKIHARADLIGELDRIVARIDDIPEDEDADDLIEQYYQTRDEFLGSTAMWTVEKRSSEWVTAHREATARDLGITIKKDGTAVNEKGGLTLLLEQIAAQVVEINGEPADVTAAQLRKMYDANEGEVNKLVAAVENVNTSVAQAAKSVLTRDFSRRSSTSRAGQGS